MVRYDKKKVECHLIWVSLFLPAVGDFTDNVKRFFKVDSVRNHLKRQSDVSIPWGLKDTRGQNENQQKGGSNKQ